MSGEGGEDESPDLTEAVLGFRIWSLGVKGTLGAIAAGSIWSPGVNRAICCPSAVPAKRPAHRSPHPGCVCGFNAFAELNTQLRVQAGIALGAIAAWGEIDVYQTGFRAEYAQVVTLALPPQSSSTRGIDIERVELAAVRYDVPLVPRGELVAEACRHASPVAPSVLPTAAPAPTRTSRAASGSPRSSLAPVTRGRARIATWDDARGHGIWVRRHVAARCHKNAVDLGPAPAATALLAPDPEVSTLPLGTRVEAGDVVATIGAAYPGRSIHLLSPLSGTVSGLNPGFAADLLEGDVAVSGAPRLLTLTPDAGAPLDDAPLLWDRPAVELYRQGVLGRSDASVFVELGPPPGFDQGALRPLEQSRSPTSTGRLPLHPHQRFRTSLSPEKGRRAAITVEHLRPLLHASGVAGGDDLLLA